MELLGKNGQPTGNDLSMLQIFAWCNEAFVCFALMKQHNAVEAVIHFFFNHTAIRLVKGKQLP